MTAQPPAKIKVENSLSVRLASLVLSLISISLACHYVMVPRLIAFAYIFTCLLGSFCAYYFRKKENPWITVIAVLGTLVVMGNFAQEVFFQFYVGRLNPIGPFISVLAGLLALHTLDLRTRVDVNTAALIGLGLMGCIGMLANDLIFGLSVLVYLLIGAVLLYFQCISSSLAGVGKKTRDQEAPAYGVTQPNLKRTIGSNIAVIASLPIFALFLFINLPRIDSLIDRLVVELTARGFPFRVMITGATELVDNVWGNATAGDLYGNGPGYGKGPGNGALAGSSSGAGAQGKERTTFGLQITTGDGKGLAAGGKTPSGSGYGLGMGGPSQGNMALRTGKASQSEAVEFSQTDPTKQEEMMLLYQDKKASAQDSTVLFTMTSSREVFLKRLVFDYFDGHRWKAQERGLLMTIDLNPDALSDLSIAPPLVRPRTGSVDVPQEITANANLGHIIPAASTPQKLQFPAEQVFVDKYGSLRTAGEITPGTKFKLISKVPIFNPKHLMLNSPSAAEEKLARSTLNSDLQIPADLPIEVRYLAKAIVGREKNWFSQAERICEYLRSNFEYSLNTPSETEENAVKQFLLESKKGDCTQFASAFVMLCRSLGIPSRCVGGFAPGTRNIVTGLTELRWRNSHAWAEVYIPRFGWVPFDAVPGGYLPSDRPERNILASLAETQLAKSLAKVVDNVAKAKGLHRPDEELEAEDNISNRASKGSKQGRSDTKPQLAQRDFHQEQNVTDTTDKPVLRIEGIATRSSQQIDRGILPKLLHLGGRLESIDLSWLATYWRPFAAIAALVVFIAISLKLLGQNYQLFQGKLKPVKKATAKFSTLAFMRVMNDLGRLKFKRAKGDTGKEVVDKVVKRLAEMQRPAWQEALPGLLTSFMEIYCLNRFAESESAEHKAKLQDIEKEIHLLLTSA